MSVKAAAVRFAGTTNRIVLESWRFLNGVRGGNLHSIDPSIKDVQTEVWR